MAVVSLCPIRLAAHQINLSHARIELKPDRTVRLEIAFKGSDVDRVVGTKVFDPQSGLVDASRLTASTAAIAAYVTTHAVVHGADGTLCKASNVKIVPDQDGVTALLTLLCSEVEGDLIYRATALIDVDPSAKQVVLLGLDTNATQALLDASQTEVKISTPPPPLLDVTLRYVYAGVEHIFLGYDHVAFLIAIVLWARRLWPVVKIVTAFTVAHSITLSLAVLKIVAIPSSIVEPAIAVSIVYVAIENFFSHNIERRWRDTLAFGLVHGFGFASALQEFGLPRGAVGLALATFNVGVEIGQMAIVSLVIPLLIGVDRLTARMRGVPPDRTEGLVYAISGIIACLGCYWFLDRTILGA
jgi:hydrogenase/urease accessory protein HupE